MNQAYGDFYGYTTPIGLEAGPAMDRAVAEACGLTVKTETFWDGYEHVTKDCFYDGEKFRGIAFRPSTDWNDG